MSTKAHKSTVTSLRFFPSSRVILSSSADFSLQIYPADPLSPSSSTLPPENHSTRIPSVRTLLPLPSSSSPHTRPSPISATAILGRGRTILSASNSSDGAIRTWDVSKGIEVEESVGRTGGGGGGVNKIVFVEDDDRAEAGGHWAVNGTGAGGEGQGASGTIPAGDRDGGQAQAQEVKGKLFCTLQDGSFEVFQISSPSSSSRPKSLFKSTRSPHGALTAVAVSSIQAILLSSSFFKKFQLLATGTSGGVITVYAIAIPPSSSSSISPSSHVQPEIEAEAEALSQSLSLSTPLVKFRRSDAGIEDLAFTSLPSSSDGTQGLGLVVATTDGLPWIAKLKLSPLSLTSQSGSFSAGTEIEEVKVEIGVEVGIYAELTGGDVDPVRGVAVVGHSRLGEGELEGDGTEVWTAGDDGVVRRYLL
ncbi:hypothetical protein D9758_015064 [Tetrapyrgos nigripes]|uniref:Uncharacterized protein n=1 Tax=Tetrapyrgos nigripes TaxID=182062 RepID=A0A8H5CTB4_9AGAR|nr:hypothetical protein D9758_015064 [Tetrapyrgos nigripes]